MNRAMPCAAADRLIAAVKALGAPVRHERSLRLQPGPLHAHRFLLNVLPRQNSGDAWARLQQVGHAMQMPKDVAAWLQDAPRDASAVHFGFEGDGERCVVKLYVERPAVASADGAPVLLHEACKWTLGEAGHVLSRYHWFPGLDADAIATRLQSLMATQPQALQLALQALEVVRERPGLQYLEVTEPGQPRASFDLNLYDAGLEVRALQPLLAGARDAFALPPGRLQVLVDQLKSRRLGHLAGGVHRDGQPFFTLYFGMTTWPPC
jgi:tryptophan halogenase